VGGGGRARRRAAAYTGMYVRFLEGT